MRIFKLFIILIAVTIVICSCSSNAKQVLNNEKEVSSDSIEIPKISTSNESSYSNTPATKTDDFKPITVGQRPYAVMIDNEGTRVLPQGGMFLAQVIYEIVVEGGESRLMPIFWGVEPELIGPVRSSRHYFLDYALENDAIYIHFGYSPQARQDIKTLKINNINGVGSGGEIFWDLTKDRNNWQDSYTSMYKIKEYVKKANYRTSTEKETIFSYKPSAIEPQGLAANIIDIKFSTASYCSFQYDTVSKLYNRFREGKPHMERTNGQQLTAQNIIVQFAQNNTISGDKHGRQDVKTIGKGKGYYISRGKYVNINWSKASRSAATKYTLQDGLPLEINPGQTWVEILPTGGKVTFKE